MVDITSVVACLVLGADPVLIGAVIKHESNWDHTAFNVNRWHEQTYQTRDVRKNAAAIDVFINNGYSVDVGLMQINSDNLTKYNVTVLDAFDVCTNVQLGEAILLDAIATAQNSGLGGDDAIKAGLSIYNTGSLTRGFDNGYVNRVWAHYQASTDYAAKTSDTLVVYENAHDWFDYASVLVVDVSANKKGGDNE